MTQRMEDCPHGQSLLRTIGTTAVLVVGGLSWYGTLENVDLGLGGTMGMHFTALISPLVLLALLRKN